MMQSSIPKTAASSEKLAELPTAEHAQHGSENSLRYRGGARVRSGAILLRQDSKIGNTELVAVDRWYRDHVFVEYGAFARQLDAAAAKAEAMAAGVSAEVF